MKAKFIAMITAGAIATSGLSATTANANSNDDLFRILAGIAIIAAITNNANDGTVTVTPSQHHVKNNRRIRAGNFSLPRRCFKKVSRNPAKAKLKFRKSECLPPRQCLRKRHTRNGWVKSYAHRCLQRTGWLWAHPHFDGARHREYRRGW